MANLTIECWLVISKSRKYGEVSARLAKQSPKLAPGEIPIKLKMNVPVFVKQMGTAIAKERRMVDHHGGDIDEFPLTLQIRQFPRAYGLDTALHYMNKKTTA